MRKCIKWKQCKKNKKKNWFLKLRCFRCNEKLVFFLFLGLQVGFTIQCNYCSFTRRKRRTEILIFCCFLTRIMYEWIWKSRDFLGFFASLKGFLKTAVLLSTPLLTLGLACDADSAPNLPPLFYFIFFKHPSPPALKNKRNTNSRFW